MRQVMWHGTVRSLRFESQLRATELARCSVMSMTPFAYKQLRDSGCSARDVRRRAADHGVALFHLDPLIRWIDSWSPDLPQSAFPYAMLSFTADEFFRMAEELEVESFTAWGAFPAGSIPQSEIVDAFGALCERAARSGLACDMEFLPMFGIRNLAEAWAIVHAVNRPNARLAFDFWHFFRGGADFALLESLPGTAVGCVQLCDATADLPPGVPMGVDGQTARRLPGEGEFDVARTLAALERIGGLNNVGCEIFSTEFDRMDADAIGTAVHASMTRWFPSAFDRPTT